MNSLFIVVDSFFVCAFPGGIHSALHPAAEVSQTNFEECAHYYDSALQLTIYTVPSTKAEYPGGLSALIKQTNSIRLTRNEVAIADEKVFINLYIDSEGEIVATKIPNKKAGEYSVLEKKVIEQLKSKKWKAATCRTRNVASIYLYVVQYCFFE